MIDEYVRTGGDGDGDGLVVLDAGAAAPTTDAVRDALKVLARRARDGGERRRSWAVLGGIDTGGDDPIAAHDGIGRLAVRLDVSRLVVVGAGRALRAMFQGAVMEGSWGAEATHVADATEAQAVLRAELGDSDVVLVAGVDLAATLRRGEVGRR